MQIEVCWFYIYRIRFRNHKSAMINNKKTREMAVHYNCTEHGISKINFIVIEKIMNHRNATLVTIAS